MSHDENDILTDLKHKGYRLAQGIYKSESRYKLDDIIKKYCWKMFNYIYANKKLEFIFYIERLYASHGIQPPKILIEFLQEQNLMKFKEFALAFMMGFISDKKEKKVIQPSANSDVDPCFISDKKEKEEGGINE